MKAECTNCGGELNIDQYQLAGVMPAMCECGTIWVPPARSPEPEPTEETDGEADADADD